MKFTAACPAAVQGDAEDAEKIHKNLCELRVSAVNDKIC
jgi:hypothetical protein